MKAFFIEPKEWSVSQVDDNSIITSLSPFRTVNSRRSASSSSTNIVFSLSVRTSSSPVRGLTPFLSMPRGRRARRCGSSSLAISLVYSEATRIEETPSLKSANRSSMTKGRTFSTQTSTYRPQIKSKNHRVSQS